MAHGRSKGRKRPTQFGRGKKQPPPDSDDESLFPDRQFKWLHLDLTVEKEIADTRREPFNEIRRKENLVVEFPKAFDEFKPIKHEVKLDEDDLAGLDVRDRIYFPLYCKEYVETEGFDIEHFPNGGIGVLSPLDFAEGGTDIVVMDFQPTLQKAIKYFNMKHNRKLVLGKIHKCNYRSGSMYFATFDVKDQDTEDTLTYQAKLARDHYNGKTEIHRFRLKPGSQPELKNDA